jgi:hypothetical protein
MSSSLTHYLPGLPASGNVAGLRSEKPSTPPDLRRFFIILDVSERGFNLVL